MDMIMDMDMEPRAWTPGTTQQPEQQCDSPLIAWTHYGSSGRAWKEGSTTSPDWIAQSAPRPNQRIPKYLHTGIHYPGTIPSPRSPTQVSPWYPSLGSSHQWGSSATQKLTTTTTTTTAIRDNHNNVLGAMWSNLGTQKAPWAWDILQPTSNTGTKYKQEDLCHRIPTIEFSPQLNNLSGLISSIS